MAQPSVSARSNGCTPRSASSSRNRPNELRCADITYIPIGRGFLNLVAIMGWASRAWRLSNSMHSSFAVAALEEALARLGRPEISTRAASSPAPPHSPARCSLRRTRLDRRRGRECSAVLQRS
jgi:hypothetical protein